MTLKVRLKIEMAAIVIIFAFLSVIFFLLQNDRHEEKIGDYIRSIGGEVINIERRSFFTGLGPFMVVGKGRKVYRIEYKLGNEIKEGWVRFGGILGPDWKL